MNSLIVMAPKENWTIADAPGLAGKLAIVTGATGGLGFEMALGLARKGAVTILAGRNPDKGARAVERIRQKVASAIVRFELLDLASLESVAQFAAGQGHAVDILINNAGVMGFPRRRVTEDGFEAQIGVNYLAHFALVGHLKNALCAAAGGGRVVCVASLAHRRATLDLTDLQAERSYDPKGVYARSKLAMLVFALELHRRAELNNWSLRSIAVHPGWARTEIIGNGPGSEGGGVKAKLTGIAFGMVAQLAADGALPALYAATAPEACSGAYYGPSRFGETRGAPGLSRISPQAASEETGARLWELSEKLTGVSFDR